MNTPILEVSDIQKYYGNKGNITKAVNRISLSAHKSLRKESKVVQTKKQL